MANEDTTTTEEVIVAPSRSTTSSPDLPVHTHRRRRTAAKNKCNSIIEWGNGPDPPRHLQIKPLFPRIQSYPLRLVDKYCPKRRHKAALWAFACLVWLVVFVAVEHRSRFVGSAALVLSCSSSLWSKNNGCGIDGMDCRPFTNTTFTFRCSSNCAESSHVLNPWAVGSQSIIYRSFVIGGGVPSSEIDPNIRHYRGDSFICAAAVHAGVVKNNGGGCAKAIYTGTQPYFTSSNENGIDSIPVDADFPFSFTVAPVDDAGSCSDLRWPVFGVTFTFTMLVSLFTSSPTVFFATLFSTIFFETAMASDPPFVANPYDLVSNAVSRFLPAVFAAVVIERWVVRRTLAGLTAQIEKTILWTGACWFGALNNYTFDVVIPITRLTPRDLAQQPGAKAALAIIVFVLIIVVIIQALHIRLEGQFWKYLGFYIALGVGLALLVAIPGLNLRIHHYILGLILLPGTRIQTRPSLVYQGLLVGLFINGIARWGWDGLLQTNAAIQGDGLGFSALPVVSNVVVGPANVTLEWIAPTWPWDSVSVLVNDVEKYRGQEDSFTVERRLVSEIVDEGMAERSEVMQKRDGGDEGEREKMYVRLGFVSGASAGDFTRALTVYANGTWTMMEPGAT